MKFFRIDLLTLLISLFILSSCKNQDGIGLTPDQTLNGTMVVDDNITVNTVPEDTVVTSGLTKTPLGYFKDPQIGTTESNIAVALSLPSSTAYTLPTGTINIDSAVLVLGYADGFYGDSLNSKYKVNVYQLAEKPLTTLNYYNTKSWSYNSANLLGTKSFTARTHTSIKISDIVTGAKDTLKTVAPQLRVPISSTFINNILFGASSTVLASNTLFQAATKGLYITMDKNQTGPGGNFMIIDTTCRIDIYYRAVDGSTIDTAVVSLPSATRAAEIKHTYTTTIQAALANQATSNSVFYVQAAGGLRTKLSFPGVKTLMTKAGGDIVINRAELVITPSAGTTIPFVPQSKLSLYRLDIAKQRIPLQDGSYGSTTGVDIRAQGVDVFGGYYTSLGDYHFIVTAFVDDMMRGRTIDYGTYLSAVDNTNTTSVDYLPTAQTAGRMIGAGTVTNTTAADYAGRIKLNIIYTKVNK